jgi:hypothetical protein
MATKISPNSSVTFCSTTGGVMNLSALSSSAIIIGPFKARWARAFSTLIKSKIPPRKVAFWPHKLESDTIEIPEESLIAMGQSFMFVIPTYFCS